MCLVKPVHFRRTLPLRKFCIVSLLDYVMRATGCPKKIFISKKGKKDEIGVIKVMHRKCIEGKSFIYSFEKCS